MYLSLVITNQGVLKGLNEYMREKVIILEINFHRVLMSKKR